MTSSFFYSLSIQSFGFTQMAPSQIADGFFIYYMNIFWMEQLAIRFAPEEPPTSLSEALHHISFKPQGAGSWKHSKPIFARLLSPGSYLRVVSMTSLHLLVDVQVQLPRVVINTERTFLFFLRNEHFCLLTWLRYLETPPTPLRLAQPVPFTLRVSLSSSPVNHQS